MCTQVGQIQLIRRQIHREMNRTCKFDSKLLANSLQALNQWVCIYTTLTESGLWMIILMRSVERTDHGCHYSKVFGLLSSRFILFRFVRNWSSLSLSLSISLTRSLLTAIEAHYKDPSIPYPGEDNAILFELTPYLESAGFHDPLSKVSVTEWCYRISVCRGICNHLSPYCLYQV